MQLIIHFLLASTHTELLGNVTHTWTKPVKKEKDSPKFQWQAPSPFDIRSMYIIHRSNHVTQLIKLKLLDKSINSTSKPEATGESNPPLLLPNHANYWSQDPHRMTETTDIIATSIASKHIASHTKVLHESYQGTNRNQSPSQVPNYIQTQI